jgi:cysteine-rich secretory family protein
MRLRMLITAIALAAASVPPALMPAGPALASNPEQATISFRHPSQVFTESHPMQGGAPAGFVQTICNTQQDACDPVTFTVDPRVDGKIDHQSLLTVEFENPPPSMMALAQYPEGCPEDDNPVGACATYFQTDPPYLFPDPGVTTVRLKVVCQLCINGTYTLKATLSHVLTAASLPTPGDRANILNCTYRHIGVGVAQGGSYGTYWTQDFGG